MAGRPHVFTRVELFFIQGHHDKMDPEAIAEELGIKNVDQIREKVAEFKKNKLPNAYDMMIKESENRKHKVAVMTQGASQIGDEQRKKTNRSVKESCTHVINPDRK